MRASISTNPPGATRGVTATVTGPIAYGISANRRASASVTSIFESEIERRLRAGAYPAGQAPDSVILLEDGVPYEGSEAALRIARRLGPPWSTLRVLRIVPRKIREWVYGAVARRRYGWFGRMDACPVPDPNLRGRFLS